MVFIFNEHRILTGVEKSLYCTSEAYRISAQTISLCCTGKRISSNGFYFRHSHPNVRIDIYEDVDNLTLEEYDELCGEQKRYHSTREMKKRKTKAGRTKKSNTIK
jgi:hypothetical protein